MLKSEVIGNVGSDVEIKQFKSGHKYAAFVVAHDKGRDKAPVWVRVSWTGGIDDPRLQYIKKGAKVCVRGDLVVSAYMDKNGAPAAGIDIYAESVEIVLFAKKDDGAQGAPAGPAPAAQAQPAAPAGPAYVPNAVAGAQPAAQAQAPLYAAAARPTGPCPVPTPPGAQNPLPPMNDPSYTNAQPDDLPF